MRRIVAIVPTFQDEDGIYKPEYVYDYSDGFDRLVCERVAGDDPSDPSQLKVGLIDSEGSVNAIRGDIQPDPNAEILQEDTVPGRGEQPDNEPPIRGIPRDL